MSNNQQQKINIWWDKKEDIIREALIGNLTEEDAKKSINEVNKLATSMRREGLKP